jgi:hypothetical protein
LLARQAANGLTWNRSGVGFLHSVAFHRIALYLKQKSAPEGALFSVPAEACRESEAVTNADVEDRAPRAVALR